MHELRSILGALQYYSRFISNFSQKASDLFDILSYKSFYWHADLEKQLRCLLNYLQSDTVLRPFSPKLHSTIITDASPCGIGAISEQEGRPVICVSCRLSKAEHSYSQTHREALTVYRAVKRLHKYVFGTKFTIVTDHKALKFIYDSLKSLSRSSVSMVQRYSIALSAYDYNIVHRNAKFIPHADFLSRKAQDTDELNKDGCLLVQPLSIQRGELIRNTRSYFSSLISALRRGWKESEKRRFPSFYSRRDELSFTPDGLLCFLDRIVIPPSLRRKVLSDLHSGHLGVEKMKSLVRLTCWWPEISADIIRIAKSCDKCVHKIHSQSSKWMPWPSSCEIWQRIHADYCGPFLGKFYALVVVDSCSRWPEVYFNTHPTAQITQQALRKLFSSEGVPMVLVTDNETHFNSKEFEEWLKGIGC